MKQKNNSIYYKLCLILFLNFGIFLSISAQVANAGMRDITAFEVAEEMAPGVNLFNTLDAVIWWEPIPHGLESENCWGQPTTTPEMVEAIAERGFKTLRIPVTWYNHIIPGSDFIVDTVWMDRVEETVNYAMDNNLYAIINIHHEDYNTEHEGSWLSPTYEMQDTVTYLIDKLWTQIATRFRDYSDYLIFEVMNEPHEVGSPKEWSGGTYENRDVVNKLNQAAVNAIRATGGNNEKRFIMVTPLGERKDFVVPENDPNLLISIHAYYPYNFTLNSEGTSKWGTEAEVLDLKNKIMSYHNDYIADGLPVIMGEWGAGDKDNYDQRINYYQKYTDFCKEAGVTPITWMYDFNRTTLTWEHPLIEEAILQAYDSAYVPVENITINFTKDTLYTGDTLQLSATIFPETASTKDIAWTSSNKNRATVSSSGIVEAHSEGNVTIKATTIGKEVECNLVVVDTFTYTHFFIEAEDYAGQSGVEVENCTDTNGGQNVGNIENNDWCTYNLSIDSTGIYDLTTRVATASNGGSIIVVVGYQIVDTIMVEGSKSDGWQDWFTTEPAEIKLNKGNYKIKLFFRGNSGYLFNLNWFRLDFNRPLSATSIQNMQENNFVFNVYPNPFSDVLQISYQLDSQSDIDIKLLNMNGMMVRSIESCSHKLPGKYILSYKGNDLPKGFYLLTFTRNNQTFSKKVFLKK